MAYLKDPDKKKCHDPGEAHMNHGERYRKRKIKVFWREKPLPKKKYHAPTQTFPQKPNGDKKKKEKEIEQLPCCTK